jgi:hypothetical protein
MALALLTANPFPKPVACELAMARPPLVAPAVASARAFPTATAVEDADPPLDAMEVAITSAPRAFIAVRAKRRSESVAKSFMLLLLFLVVPKVPGSFRRSFEQHSKH